MTPGWTSRSEDASATVDAALRWGRRRRTVADLADVGRACAGLASTLTALCSVAEDASRGLYRYSGGALLVHDVAMADDWHGQHDRGEAAVEAARSHLDIALKLLSHVADETSSARGLCIGRSTCRGDEASAQIQRSPARAYAEQ